MNQDQTKDLLLKLDDDVAEFKLIFSGKSSKKVNGLYHPETCEIIIHNKNFTNDNSLIYTAIHEFAHHIQFTRFEAQVTMRAHTMMFWDLFHRLLQKAEEMNLYRNIFQTDKDFLTLTNEIKEGYLHKNGELMKSFGKLLIQALDLCQQKQAIFDDYVERVLGFNRSVARSIMKMYALDIDSSLGYDNMKMVSRIKEPDRRAEAEKGLKEGKTHQMVRQELKASKPSQPTTIKQLEAQKRRIIKSMETMQERLQEVDQKIEELSSETE